MLSVHSFCSYALIFLVILDGTAGMARRAPISNIGVKNMDSAGYFGFIQSVVVRIVTKS